MIIGDPYKFSIFVKEIKEWNTENSTFHNGILFFCIDGELYPKRVETATLSYEINELKRILKKAPINEKIYNMEKEKAFVEMYNVTYPEDYSDNDYRYYISPSTFSHRHYCVFMVSTGSKIRIMASKLEYIISESRHKLNNLDINETFLSNAEFSEIVSQLDQFLW